MVVTRAITDTQRAEAEAIPVETEVGKRAPKEATVADDKSGTQYFVDYVRRQLVKTYGEDAVLRGGLRVQTTLDPKLQRQAYEAVYGTLNWRGDPAGDRRAHGAPSRVRALAPHRAPISAASPIAAPLASPKVNPAANESPQP